MIKLNTKPIILALLFLSLLTDLSGCRGTANIDANSSAANQFDSADRTENWGAYNQRAVGISNEIQSSAVQANQAQEVFYGEWIIKRVLAYGRAGTYSTGEAESLLGRKLSFSESKASCFGDRLSDIDRVAVNPVYKKTENSKNDFILNYRMTFEQLGITADSIQEISVSGAKGNGCIFFIKDKNTLILYGGGTYFEMNRVTV